MNAYLPWSLLVGWILFLGFSSTHQRHLRSMEERPAKIAPALRASIALAGVSLFGILIYHFTKAPWYWTLLLFFAGGMSAGVVFGVLDTIVGRLNLSLIAFVGWPMSAAWCAYEVWKLG